jgi:riboflavin kinase/FMN adenylyltransferase
MDIFRNIDEIKRSDATVISIGTFDGVHCAHRKIIEKVLQLAKDKKSRSLIVTFDPHPQEVLKNKSPEIKILTSTEEKLEQFRQLGIDTVWLVNFTPDFAKTDAKDFYEKLVYSKIGISDLVIGYDHVFGRNRDGDFNTLTELSKKFNFNIHKVEEIDIDGIKVSSTKIRRYLADGNMEIANKLLGYNYSLEGIVVEGDKVARSLGFPTANLYPVKENKVIPGDGVYAVKVNHGSEEFYGMMYIGFRPTLTEGKKHVIEVNIFDFDSNLYGEKLSIGFLSKTRDEMKLSSKEEIIKQIQSDKTEIQEYLKINHLENK